MFTIAVCDDDMQERMQEVQIVKNIFSQKELEAGIEEFQTVSFCQKITSGGRTYRGGRKLDTAEYKNGMSGV